MLRDSAGLPDAIVIASGSEVSLAMEAATRLRATGTDVRVVSMPNPGRFLAQDRNYREAVLPSAVRARVAVEAGVTNYWHVFVGDRGRVLGIDTFGASAPAKELFEHYGITVEKLIDAVTAVI